MLSHIRRNEAALRFFIRAFAFKKQFSHAAQVKYIKTIVLAEIGCLPIGKNCIIASQQSMLEQYKVCYIEASVCIDIAL